MRKSLLNTFYLTLVLVFTFEPTARGQGQVLRELFHNTHQVFSLQRNALGIYRDSKVFNGVDFHPASTANIGVGMIDICIAEAMEWTTDAEEQVLQTLRNIIGRGGAFQPDRNDSGYYRHFLNMNTGEQAWDSEYSTIDSGILTIGALFARNYYCSNDSIVFYANLVWNSIDWSQAIANVETGAIYREMLGNGSGKIGTEALPFNEYMLVAWLALNQENDIEGPAHQLWAKHFSSPDGLPKKQFQGIELLADNSNYFLSHFVVQFCYFLCNAFINDLAYIRYFENARLADSLWWTSETNAESHQWGIGAGSSPGDTSYVAYSLNHNPYQVYSPHIIAGFIPVNADGADDLVQLYEETGETYLLPTLGQESILWRRSLVLPSWSARDVQGIDYASMLFGLASLPRFLGADFFRKYNNFFDFDCEITNNDSPATSREIDFKISPNPFQSSLTIELEESINEKAQVELLNLRGRVIHSQSFPVLQEGIIEINVPRLASGIYFVVIKKNQSFTVRKAVKL